MEIKQLVQYSTEPAWGFGTLTTVIIIVMHIYKYYVYKLQYQGPGKAGHKQWRRYIVEMTSAANVTKALAAITGGTPGRQGVLCNKIC